MNKFFVDRTRIDVASFLTGISGERKKNSGGRRRAKLFFCYSGEKLMIAIMMNAV